MNPVRRIEGGETLSDLVGPKEVGDFLRRARGEGDCRLPGKLRARRDQITRIELSRFLDDVDSEAFTSLLAQVFPGKEVKFDMAMGLLPVFVARKYLEMAAAKTGVRLDWVRQEASALVPLKSSEALFAGDGISFVVSANGNQESKRRFRGNSGGIIHGVAMVNDPVGASATAYFLNTAGRQARNGFATGAKKSWSAQLVNSLGLTDSSDGVNPRFVLCMYGEALRGYLQKHPVSYILGHNRGDHLLCLEATPEEQRHLMTRLCPHIENDLGRDRDQQILDRYKNAAGRFARNFESAADFFTRIYGTCLKLAGEVIEADSNQLAREEATKAVLDQLGEIYCAISQIDQESQGAAIVELYSKVASSNSKLSLIGDLHYALITRPKNQGFCTADWFSGALAAVARTVR